MRKVHIGDEVWWWEMGGPGVVIRGPNKAKSVVPIDEITGIPWGDAERMQEKNQLHVKPSQVKDYIEKHLAKE